MEGMLGPLCLCCGPLGSSEVRAGLGNAGLKLVHAIVEPLLRVLGLIHQNMAEIAAWDTVSFKAGLYVPSVQEMNNLTLIA